VLAGHLLGGADRYAISLAEGLKERHGYNTSFACLSEGSGAEAARASGFPVHLLDKRYRGDLGCATRLATVASRAHVDLVHSHTFGTNFYTCLAMVSKRSLRSIPVVQTMHGLDFGEGRNEHRMAWKMRAALRLDRLLQFRTATVIVISRHARAILERQGYPPVKLRTIHNAIPPVGDIASLRARGAALRTSAGLDRLPLIGTIGRMVPVKRQRAMLEAVRLLLDRGVNLNAALLGDGLLRSRLEQKVVELGIAEHVRFMGVRPDALEWLCAMDVFCLPSMSEGIPLVLLEAMSVGTPVVASAAGGIPEVLQDNCAGRLIRPGDATALADAVAAILNEGNGNGRIERIVAARRIVDERFSFDRLLSEVRKVYNDCWNDSETPGVHRAT